MDTMTIAFEDKKMISVLRQLIQSMNGVRIIQTDTDVEVEEPVAVSSLSIVTSNYSSMLTLIS